MHARRARLAMVIRWVCGSGGGTEKASRTVELRNRRRRWPTSGDQRVTLWWRRAPAWVVSHVSSVRVAAGTARPVITASYVPTDGQGNESEPAVSHCVTSSSHLFPSPPIQAAAVGREGGGADSTSHILGKHELKGQSRLCLPVWVCEYYRHEASTIGRSVNR